MNYMHSPSVVAGRARRLRAVAAVAGSVAVLAGCARDGDRLDVAHGPHASRRAQWPSRRPQAAAGSRLQCRR